MAGAVKDAYSPDVEVEVIYKGDMPDMPGPPNIAVEGRLLGKDIAAEKLEEILMELIRNNLLKQQETISFSKWSLVVCDWSSSMRPALKVEVDASSSNRRYVG